MGSGSHPSREILLLTDKRILYIVRGGDIFANNTTVINWLKIRQNELFVITSNLDVYIDYIGGMAVYVERD